MAGAAGTSEIRVPAALAVVLWAASGLAVLSYTYLAYKETSGGKSAVNTGGLSANQAVLDAELLGQVAPLKRHTGRRFKKGNTKVFNTKPSQMGF